MTELFSQFDIDHVSEVLRQRGKPYGITFGDMTRLSNSRLALETAEFARDHGEYHAVHTALFKSYFTDGADIGDMDILKSVVDRCNLNPETLATAIEDGRYSKRVANGSRQARKDGVTAMPTFIIEGQNPITGAVSEAVFRETLQAAAERQGRASTTKYHN